MRAQGALRAAQGLPLSALLHSYRLGHRTVWERLVQVLGDREDVLDAVLALTTLTLGYTDLISAALAEGYVEQQRHLLVELDRDRRDLLENLLLGSAGQRAETVQLATTFDLLPATELAVAVVGQRRGAARRSAHPRGRDRSPPPLDCRGPAVRGRAPARSRGHRAAWTRADGDGGAGDPRRAQRAVAARRRVAAWRRAQTATCLGAASAGRRV